MRRFLALAAFLVLSCSFCQDALAFGKAPVDPNTLPREEQKGFWDSDTRLEQKVTLVVRRETVSGIMSVLSKMTGVTLYPGYNSKDWQVRDRKMNIIAKDMPLKELMQSIARTMKFKWSKSKSEPYTYRIFMDRRTLLEAEGQAYRAEKKLEELLTQRREVLENKMAEAADLDPAELEKMRDANPYMYVMAKSGFAGPMSEFLQMVPEAREAFLNRSQAVISGDMLPEAAYSAAASMARAMLKMRPVKSSYPELDNADNTGKVYGIKFNTSEHYNPTTPLQRRTNLGSITMAYKIGHTTSTGQSFPFMDPETSMVKSSGLHLLYEMEKDPDSPDPDPSSFSVTLRKGEWDQLTKESDFGEQMAKHTPEDLAVKKKEKAAADTGSKTATYTTAEEMILTIAEATDMNIVSDYLGKQVSGMSTTMESHASFNRLVGSLENMFGYNWWRHGNALEFRDRYWFKKRSLQIPESYIESWRKHFKENGTLEIDDLAQIAALTGDEEQYGVNINGDEVLGNESMHQAVSWQLKPLRFYDSLSKQQRSALLTEEGLSQDSLTPEQSDYLRSFTRIGGFTEPLKMTVKRSPGRNDYKVFMPRQSFEATVFSIWTPKYEPVKGSDSVSPTKAGRQQTQPSP